MIGNTRASATEVFLRSHGPRWIVTNEHADLIPVFESVAAQHGLSVKPLSTVHDQAFEAIAPSESGALAHFRCRAKVSYIGESEHNGTALIYDLGSGEHARDALNHLVIDSNLRAALGRLPYRLLAIIPISSRGGEFIAYALASKLAKHWSVIAAGVNARARFGMLPMDRRFTDAFCEEHLERAGCASRAAQETQKEADTLKNALNEGEILVRSLGERMQSIQIAARDAEALALRAMRTMRGTARARTTAFLE